MVFDEIPSIAVAAGGSHTLVLTSENTVFSWGKLRFDRFNHPLLNPDIGNAIGLCQGVKDSNLFYNCRGLAIHAD